MAYKINSTNPLGSSIYRGKLTEISMYIWNEEYYFGLLQNLILKLDNSIALFDLTWDPINQVIQSFDTLYTSANAWKCCKYWIWGSQINFGG